MSNHNDAAVLDVKQQQDNEPQHDTPPPINYSTLHLSFKQRIGIFIGLASALFLAALDQTIVATALPVIGSEFSQLEKATWIIVSYMLGMTIIQPLFGKICDIFGRKDALFFSVATFLIGSALCGASQSMLMLILSRLVAGVGCGGIYTVTFIIMADVIPLREQGKYSSIIGLVYTVANVVGPVIGGVMSDKASWRWIFYLNIPICVMTLVFTVVLLKGMLPVPHGSLKNKVARLDVVGSLVVVASLTSLVLGTSFIADTLQSTSTWALVGGLFAACVVLMALFVWVEARFAKEPIVPLHLFRQRNVSLVLIINFIWNWVFMTVLIYMALYFQVAKKTSATVAGFQMIPLMLVTVAIVTLTGFAISRTGYLIPFINVGLGILTLGTGLLLILTPWTSSIAVEVVVLVVIGLGVGMVAQTTRIAAQASVETKDLAIVTTLTNLMLTVGGLVGIAVDGAIFGSILSGALNSKLGSLPGMTEEVLRGLANDVQVLLQQPSHVQDLAVEAYWEAFRVLFLFICPFSAVAFLLSLWLKHHQLKKEEIVVEEVQQQQQQVA